jgi:hypothetical protein
MRRKKILKNKPRSTMKVAKDLSQKKKKHSGKTFKAVNLKDWPKKRIIEYPRLLGKLIGENVKNREKEADIEDLLKVFTRKDLDAKTKQELHEGYRKSLGIEKKVKKRLR